MSLNRAGLRAGAMAFNSEQFHKAHEIWEAIWNDSVGDEKHVVGGLARVAAGYLKLAIGKKMALVGCLKVVAES